MSYLRVVQVLFETQRIDWNENFDFFVIWLVSVWVYKIFIFYLVFFSKKKIQNHRETKKCINSYIFCRIIHPHMPKTFIHLNKQIFRAAPPLFSSFQSRTNTLCWLLKKTNERTVAFVRTFVFNFPTSSKILKFWFL